MGRTTKARRQRLKEAAAWYPKQHFTEDSHVVKAYRLRFGVDKVCAMRELCMLGVLGPERQTAYKRDLERREQRLAAKREARKARKLRDTYDYGYQDDYFAFIVGYTSGGAPYGITWEEEARLNGQADSIGQR